MSGVTAVGRAGAAIDAAVGAGANQIYGPSLTSDDARKLYEQALEAAVKDARARAQTLAGAAGGTLGRVLTIAESSAPPMPLVREGRGLRRGDADRPRPAGDGRDRHGHVRARVSDEPWGRLDGAPTVQLSSTGVGTGSGTACGAWVARGVPCAIR